ncbi:MAG: 2-hydroxychromene-2-carboxylate isomerase [Alphaproteobacteria bacterium]|nr:2-hydroxychromene-2-carboxylate isomerase [Alphaproteobacteria bacterium]
MPKQVTYYLALNSPWAYLGSRRLAEIARKHGASVDVRPIRIDAVFAATGGLPLKQRPKQRQAYRMHELRRWRDHLNVPINLEPAHFPADETLAAQCVIAVRAAGGDALALASAFGRVIWEQERDLADAAVVRDVLTVLGHDADSIMSKARAPETAAERERLSVEAISAGVFGVPTYFVDGEPFWGQDRLDFVDRKLAR